MSDQTEAQPAAAAVAPEPATSPAAAAAAASTPERSPEERRKAIIRQIEYYFSDRNLSRDKFMKESQDPEGWIALPVLLTFKRLKELTEDPAVVVEAMRSVENDPLVEVSEDSSKLRRSPTRPLAEQATLDARSVHIKRFPEDTTFETVQNWLREAGYNPESVHMRKFIDSHKMKGSAFVQLATVAEAEKLAASGLKFNDVDMVIEMKPAYHERKRSERKAKRVERKTDEAEKKKKEQEEAFESKIDKGCILVIENLAPETTREDLKDIGSEFGEVAWVEYDRGDTQAILRFKDPAAAAAAIAALPTSGKEVKGKVPTYRLMEGDEEKEHWAKIEEARKRKHMGGKRNAGGRGRGRGGRKGGRPSKRAKTGDE